MPFRQLLEAYDAEADWALAEGNSGWNNTTRYASSAGKQWILRIYETHRDPGKIRFEHEVLLALAGSALTFGIPVPRRNAEGETFVPLQDGSGRYACLFAYLEGERPDGQSPRTAYAVGEAVGQLSDALRGVSPQVSPAYPPYYELDKAHPSCSLARVAAFCVDPPQTLRHLRGELATLADGLARLRADLPAMRSLPHQLVHGDINDSNLLAELEDRHRIAAVLDFEFCTRDVRAMEPAVVISGMLGQEGGRDAITAFARGYASVVRLGSAEADAIVPLIRLRKLDVFVHFLGRYLDGVDGADVLLAQIPDAVSGLAELEREADFIRDCCHSHMV
ncbi:phosphotransferase [Cohnella sp. REN36]|uniref:phosphotransferase n=1 Tax=Cohnella sp. REN36 TaxID=2887347 RepID=UPI001D146A14|nr:phosphotransferase [Cohnella sp. REN36]MCC3373086.1 phosphotransferase [Cohnella sp. REN36]